MEIMTTVALANSWRQYHYINHLAIKDVTVYCEDVVQSTYFWKAFQHFFKTKIEINKFLPAPQHVYDNINDYHYRRVDAGGSGNMYKQKEYELIDTYDFFKQYLKVDLYPTHPLVYSIINSDIDVKGHHKGIPYNTKKNIINNLNGIDLGDSRYFKNLDELIEKITTLANADTYLGSNCSWSNIAPYFDTTVILLTEDRYAWN